MILKLCQITLHILWSDSMVDATECKQPKQVARTELVESGISGVTGHRVIIGYKTRQKMVQYRRNRILGRS